MTVTSVTALSREYSRIPATLMPVRTNLWDNLPSDINSTISPYDIKLFIGRIMQYGYTGPISTSWRSQNPADAATLAEAMATQVLIWETVVGERDEDFDYVSPGSYDAVKGVISTAHPLYDLFAITMTVLKQAFSVTLPSPALCQNPNRAQSVELEWDGSSYTATLTDHNRVLSDYSFPLMRMAFLSASTETSSLSQQRMLLLTA